MKRDSSLRFFPLFRSTFLFSSVLTLSLSGAPAAGLDGQFAQTVVPFITKHCAGCHSGKTPAAQFDLTAYTSVEKVTRDYPHWALIAERLTAKDMPPKPMPQPPAAEAQAVIAWIQRVRAEEIRKSAGDPGLVSARRLSHAEYNYTIRDLTGHDMKITREFPIDPSNPAGFDNSGESLTTSPSLINKYLQAAREVANHMVLTPDTIDFAPHTMLVETDREKWAVQRIMAFYGRQPVKLATYFEAAWRYKHRASLGKPGLTLAAAAADAKISKKYLPVVWQLLNEPGAVGPVFKLQRMFAALPAKNDERVTQCQEMEAFVVRIRRHTGMQYAAPKVKGLPAGSQPLLHWKNEEYATHRRQFDPASLRNDTDPPMAVPTIPRYAGLHQEAAPRWAALVNKGRATDMDLVVPAKDRQRYEAAFARFATVFPDQFMVTERGRYFPDDSQDKGRLLNAGYHSVLGFFRDDRPLMELILDEKGKAELDRLWNEFDYVAQATARTFVQYFTNQAGEVDGKGAEASADRPIGKEITDSAVIEAMRDKYLAKAAADPANDPVAPKAIRFHYDDINATLRGLEKQKAAAEPKHLDALVRFAERAYRRPLTAAERTGVVAHYQTLRKKNELSHEDAVRESVVSILMAPDFLYRFDLRSSRGPAKAGGMVALDGLALANRLSYFLWASMPDAELLQHAKAGDLQQPEVLLAQARRMLKDPRVRGFATEFTGNWLMFRQFEKNNSVDRQRFPEFNDALREAMFQEPIRVMEDAIKNNRPVLDLLYGNYTFVNPVLAKHYGIPVKGEDNAEWTQVDDAASYGRGGLLPMAVFLTQNSPGLRTSPVKRGAWVVKQVLGEIIPPPPPVVPELPHDEATSELPLRAMLAKHREHALCAACHAKIDSFGLAFEGYGPVGNARKTDLAGRPVDNSASYPGGKVGVGVAGLRDFIRENREKDFVATISRKLVAFALNRSLQLSDEALVDSMRAKAAAGGFRFQALIESVVTSPQFLKKRIPAAAPPSD